MGKKLPREYWAYVSSSESLIVSTIREKPGDSEAALKKGWARYSCGVENCKLVRVKIDYA